MHTDSAQQLPFYGLCSCSSREPGEPKSKHIKESILYGYDCRAARVLQYFLNILLPLRLCPNAVDQQDDFLVSVSACRTAAHLNIKYSSAIWTTVITNSVLQLRLIVVAQALQLINAEGQQFLL